MTNFFIYINQNYLLLACHYSLVYLVILAHRVQFYDSFNHEIKKHKIQTWLSPHSEYFHYTMLSLSTLSGITLGLAIYIIKTLEPKKMLKPFATFNRQAIVLTMLCYLAIIGIYLISIVLKRINLQKRLAVTDKSYRHYIWLLNIASLALVFNLTSQFFLKMQELVAVNEDFVGSQTLLRLIGAILALICLITISACLAKTIRILPLRHLHKAIGTLFFLLLIHNSLRGLSSAARLNWLSSRNKLVFQIMIIEDQALPKLAILYGVFAIILGLYLFLHNLTLPTDKKSELNKTNAMFFNLAEQRYQRYRLRSYRRYALVLILAISINVLTVTALKTYVNRPVQLAPVENTEVTATQIIIPIDRVEDGHLHRFAYDFEGHHIRFIVVRKPDSNAYGIGLDACDICGIAGYFERGTSIICKRCDVVMNKATIGFKGGCNPVPFPYQITEGRIIIEKSSLEAEANRFPVGE